MSSLIALFVVTCAARRVKRAARVRAYKPSTDSLRRIVRAGNVFDEVGASGSTTDDGVATCVQTSENEINGRLDHLRTREIPYVLYMW
jgi:hypothetical protein